MRKNRQNLICLVFLVALSLLSLYVLAYLYADEVYHSSTQFYANEGLPVVSRNFLSATKKQMWSDEVHKPNCLCNSSFNVSKQLKCQTLHIAIVCAGHSAIRRLIPLIKSLLFYQTSAINFHFVVSNPKSQHILTVLFNSWNIPATRYFTYDASSAIEMLSWIPNKHYSGVYGLLKLAMPNILPVDLDKVIVLDNDVLFNGDPLEILQFWDKMEEVTAVFGLVENQSPWYLGTLHMKYTPWPALGLGFNTGVILMRLDFMRRMNWMVLWQSIANATLLTNGALSLADQIVHFNTMTKSSLKDHLSEYFNLRLISFLELSPLIPRSEVFQCGQNPLGHTGQTKTLNDDHFEDDLCIEYRRNVDNRIHLYYTNFDYSTSEVDDLTLVTQLSFDRMQMLEPLLSRWPGPASIAVYLTDAEARMFEHFVAESAILKSRQNVAFHLVYKHGQSFPVNKLRNVALKEVLTLFVFLIDVDFMPCPDLHNLVKRRIAAYNGNLSKIALVVPAFEYFGQNLPLPFNKTDLLALMDANYLRPFKHDEWNRGHQATNYSHWKNAKEDYKILCSLDYEPYIVTEGKVPLYDERFTGFGWNKVSHVMELEASGYEFVVLHDAFTVHLPHAPSFDISKYRTNSLYRRCLKLIKGEFMEELMRKYAHG